MAPSARTVSPQVLPSLRRVGSALDQGRSIRVLRGGMVVAEGPHVDDDERKRDNETYGTQGSAAGSRQRSAGGEGAAGRSRPAGSLLQTGSGDFRNDFEESLPKLQLDYPGTRVWDDEIGLWAVVPSFPLGPDGPQAFLVAGLPYQDMPKRRCWGYWKARRPRWIGPRHTNFPEASICAFSEDVNAWRPDQGLSQLFDFYSVWLLCQLHLQAFERWPGPQHSINSYYRLNEFREGELCSCDSGRTYFECHRPQDLLEDPTRAEQEFRASAGIGLADRTVPKGVTRFVESNFAKAPSLIDVLPWPRLGGQR
jgi:hypothetical protein